MLSIMDFTCEACRRCRAWCWRKTRTCIKLMRNLGFVVKAYPDDADFMLVTHAL
jgi:hypothetical protein